jgi:hypothetical protein
LAISKKETGKLKLAHAETRRRGDEEGFIFSLRLCASA